MALIEEVAAVRARLAPGGWRELLARHGLGCIDTEAPL